MGNLYVTGPSGGMAGWEVRRGEARGIATDQQVEHSDSSTMLIIQLVVIHRFQYNRAEC